MDIGDIIVGIDIGTSKVCCCLGQINKFNQVEILNSSSVTCEGVKKGKIVSTDAVARAIRFAVSDIEATQDFIIKSAYVNIIGKYVSIFKTKYGVKLEDKYAGVSQKNIDSLIRNVGEIEIPDGHQIIDIVPTRFITDSRITDDQIGIFTDSLEAEFDVIIADKMAVKNIGMAMQKAGLLIDGIVINGYAMKEIVLSDEEKKQVEDLVNEYIKQDLKVERLEMTKEEALKLGAEAMFLDKYGDEVTIYKIGDVSMEFCGGPHVERTGVLGTFKIKKEEASSSGVRRIKAILL